MSSNAKLEYYLTKTAFEQNLPNTASSEEALVFDSETGKLMVRPKQQAESSKRTVVLRDMNKPGPGGFF